MRWKTAIGFIILMMAITPSGYIRNGISYEGDIFNLSATVNLGIDFGNGTVVTYSDANGTNVLDATESKVDVVVEWFGDLAYVVEIEGVHNDGNGGLYWQYWVNGVRAPFAANQMQVANNDSIQWRRTTSYTTDTTTNNISLQIDSGLLIGTILTLILGPLFLGILYVIRNRRLIHEFETILNPSAAISAGTFSVCSREL